MTVEIWTGDAEDLLSRLPLDIDLLATDPPYGDPGGRAGGGQWFEGDADQAKVERILKAVWAKIRPHRHGYIFGPERDLPNSGRADLVWDKTYTTYGGPWSRSHESIWFYNHRYKSEPKTGEQLLRLRRGTVIKVRPARGKVARFHPTEKPVELWRWLFEASTLPGDLVVDPFAGAGSGAVAAVLTGRQYIGIELNPEWAAIGRERVARLTDALKEEGLA